MHTLDRILETAKNTSCIPDRSQHPLSAEAVAWMLSITEPKAIQTIHDTATELTQKAFTPRHCVHQAWFALSRRCTLMPAHYDYADLPLPFHMSLDSLFSALQTHINLGATGVCLVGGLDPELSIDGLNETNLLKTYGRLIQVIRNHFPSLDIEAYSLDEIDFLSCLTGKSPPYILDYLKDMGLNALSGNGSEMLIDRVRRCISIKKISSRTWCELALATHQAGLEQSIYFSYGHFETLLERAQALLNLFQVLVHTGITPRRILPIPCTQSTPTLNSQERLLTISLLQLLLHATGTPISSHWVLPQPEQEVQACLCAGANHPGSTSDLAYMSFLKGEHQNPLFSIDALKAFIE